MSAANIEIVRRLCEAFNRDDVDAVVAEFHESCEIREPAEVPDTPATGFRGHDGVREWMRNLRGVAGVRFEPRGFTTSGDLVLSEWSGVGLGQGSGVAFEWSTFTVVEVRGGKISRAQGFLTRDAALEAAGIRDDR
jgi:ketosteroid isomerase-like protein